MFCTQWDGMRSIIPSRVTRPRLRLAPTLRFPTMSLALNLRSPELTTAYRSILDGDPNVNWALFTYQGANDLKVQGSGAGGLEELEEEFSDGRSVFTPILDRLSPVTEVCLGFNTPL
jgi:hypothetical protein